MKKCLFVFIYLVISTSVSAQQTLIDSVLNDLKTHQIEDSILAKKYNSLAFAYRNIELDKMKFYAEKGLELSRKINYKDGEAKALKHFGSYFYFNSDYEKAVEYYNRSRLIYEEANDPLGVADTYGNIGITYENQGNLYEAIRHYEKAMKAYEKANNTFSMGVAAYNIGTAYNKKDEIDKATEYYLKSLDYALKINDTEGVGYVYQAIGSLYLGQKQYKEAKINLQKALKIRRQQNNKRQVSHTSKTIGELHEKQQKYDSAQKYYQASLNTAEELNDTKWQGVLLTNLGRVIRKEKNYADALEHFQKALEIHTKNEHKPDLANTFFEMGKAYRHINRFKNADKMLRQSLKLYLEFEKFEEHSLVYQELALLDSARGNYQKAWQNHRKYVMLKDSIDAMEKNKHFADMQTKYESNKKEQENQILKAQEEENQLTIIEQQSNLYRLTGLAILLVILAFVFLIGWRKLQQKNKLLSTQNSQIEHQHEELLIQSETLRQAHEEISATAETLKYANFNITEKKKEIEAQKEQLELKNQEVEEAYHTLKNTQSKLVQSERMASLGVLTAGVAHEINNPINFVFAGSEAMQISLAELWELIDKYEVLESVSSLENLVKIQHEISQLKDNIEFEHLKKDTFETLQDIRNGADRTAEIVRSLRTFVRLDETESKCVDIQENLMAVKVILRNRFMGRIIVEKNFAPEVSKVRCFPAKINQVFMNLLVNAEEAIEGKGTITLMTAETERFVQVSIRDTGKGVLTENRDKIFQPFYTTKERHSGLGLAIVSEIIKEHHGKIEVQSIEGQGSVFSLYLPK